VDFFQRRAASEINVSLAIDAGSRMKPEVDPARNGAASRWLAAALASDCSASMVQRFLKIT
jgi:hypothetical protein